MFIHISLHWMKSRRLGAVTDQSNQYRLDTADWRQRQTDDRLRWKDSINTGRDVPIERSCLTQICFHFHSPEKVFKKNKEKMQVIFFCEYNLEIVTLFRLGEMYYKLISLIVHCWRTSVVDSLIQDPWTGTNNFCRILTAPK